MSDLANSCEYLNTDKTCTAFNDNPKAQANRQRKCQNDGKNACCYLCIFRPQCAISCKYLGETDNYSTTKVETELVPTIDNELEGEASKFENVPVAFCFSCNVEMSWAKTSFNIDGWRGPKPTLPNKVLPTTVYLCPKCGKIEFRADITTNEERP